MTKRTVKSALLLVIGVLTSCASTGSEVVPTCGNGHTTIKQFRVTDAGPLLPQELTFDHEQRPMGVCAFSSSGPRTIHVCTTCAYRRQDSIWWRASRDPSTFARPLDSLEMDWLVGLSLDVSLGH